MTTPHNPPGRNGFSASDRLKRERRSNADSHIQAWLDLMSVTSDKMLWRYIGVLKLMIEEYDISETPEGFKARLIARLRGPVDDTTDPNS